MYYKLKASNTNRFNHAIFDADMAGLDPDNFDKKRLIFDLGTSKIEVVTRLISKHNLDILVEDDYAPNELALIYERKTNV